jgi:hypothetical protein
MTSAEKRIVELLDRWLVSLEEHRALAALDDDAYRGARDWIDHERPTVWVIEHATKQVNELKTLFERRDELACGEVAQALELMAFLANLVGSQHVRRFIPLIKRDSDSPAKTRDPASETQRRPKLAVAADPTGNTQRQPLLAAATADTGTREMPVVKAASDQSDSGPRKRERQNARHTGTRAAGRGEVGKSRNTPRAPAKPAAPTPVETAVMADAVRLLDWGRAWYELAEAISRMAGRPSLDEVRNILRDRRPEIEKTMAAKTA